MNARTSLSCLTLKGLIAGFRQDRGNMLRSGIGTHHHASHLKVGTAAITTMSFDRLCQ